MSVYRITKQGEGFEVYEIEADSEDEAVRLSSYEWPIDTRVEGAELLSVECIEKDS